MNISFYNAYTALQAYQNDLNVVSNNIANVNTVGFKTDRSSFDDLIYTKMNQHIDPELKLQGHGVMVGQVGKTFGQSSFTSTALPLDFAIADQESFFCIEKVDPNTQESVYKYTRAGNFSLSVEEEGTFLVNSNGSYVLTADKERIQLERKDDDTYNTDVLVDQIGLFRFDNKYALTKENATSYSATELSGEGMAMEESTRGILVQGMLEDSSTDLADEMVNLITAQRAFQINAKVLQTANDIEDIVNHLRG